MEDDERRRKIQETKKGNEEFLKEQFFKALDSDDKDLGLQKVELHRSIFELLHQYIDDNRPATKHELGYAVQLAIQNLALESVQLQKRLMVLESMQAAMLDVIGLPQPGKSENFTPAKTSQWAWLASLEERVRKLEQER